VAICAEAGAIIKIVASIIKKASFENMVGVNCWNILADDASFIIAQKNRFSELVPSH
jgi:hypothetical protein